MKNVCFTGHRIISNDDLLQSQTLLDDVICGLYERGAVNFYCGGAIGWDTICANMVLYLKKRKSLDITLNLVLPCAPEYQTERWNAESKRVYYAILEQADSVERISDKYFDGCMEQRNRRLVELGDCCVCYCKGKKPGGTRQTLRFAKEKGIEIINICDLL